MHRIKIQRNPDAATKHHNKDDKMFLHRILAKTPKYQIRLKLQDEKLGTLFVPWDKSNYSDKKNKKKVGQKKFNVKPRSLEDDNY